MRIKSNQTTEAPQGAVPAAVPEGGSRKEGLLKFGSKAAKPAVAAEPAPKKSWLSFGGSKKAQAKQASVSKAPPASAGLFVSQDEARTVAADTEEASGFSAPPKAPVADVVPQAPIEAAAKKSSPFSFLSGMKKPGSRAEKTGDAAEVTKAKAEKPRKEKASKQAKAEKPAKAKKVKPAKKSGVPHVLVELEDGTSLAWQVKPNGLTVADVQALGGPTASFTSKDYRFNSDLPLSASAAQTLAVAELGEDARVINASKTEKSVYASTTSRVLDFNGADVGPGLLLLESIVPFADSHGQDKVVGVQLLDDDGSLALVVLYHVTPRGEVGLPQVAVNPGELSFVLQQFLASRRLDPDSTPLTLLSNDDLLKTFSSFRAYPAEATILGMPASAAIRMGTGLMLALAVASVGYTGYGYQLERDAKAKLSRANAEKTSALQQAEALLSSSLVSFSRTQSVDIKNATEIAQQVWVPGAKVSLEANLNTATYRIEMPLTNMSSGTASVLNRVQPERLEALMEVPVPEGCTKSILNLSGGLNAAQTIVECQNAVGTLRSYRLD